MQRCSLPMLTGRNGVCFASESSFVRVVPLQTSKVLSLYLEQVGKATAYLKYVISTKRSAWRDLGEGVTL